MGNCPFCGAKPEEVPGGTTADAWKLVHLGNCPSRQVWREFCEDCGEYLDPDAEGSCGECGWVPSNYEADTLPDVPSARLCICSWKQPIPNSGCQFPHDEVTS